MSPTKRLPERFGADVSVQVRRTADSVAVTGHHYSLDCSRYFADSAAVVVVFAPPCGPEMIEVETDTRTLAALRPDGSLIASITWYFNQGAELVPFLRQRHG
jgi:hypothetical protein